jgi:hypothetical protein
MDTKRNEKTKKAPQPIQNQKKTGLTSQAPIVPLYEEAYIQESPSPISPDLPKEPSNKWMAKILIFLVIGLLFFMINYAFNGRTPAIEGNVITKEQISSEVAAGAILFNKEESAGLQAKDFEVTGLERGESARLLIWDFNAEDRDAVQIFVDGKPIHSSVVLTHTPAAFSVPVPSTVTIKGINDGGGGITYAVKFPNNKMTYFNVANVNEMNTYTLIPSP